MASCEDSPVEPQPSAKSEGSPVEPQLSAKSEGSPLEPQPSAKREGSPLDTSIGALTPEGIEFILFPAGLPARTLAYAIDQIIQWSILIFIYITAGILGRLIGAWLVLILIFCIDWFYHIICDLIFGGQSPGKRAVGLRVVRSDGAPIDPSSSFLRNLLRFADTFIFFFPIALICMSASTGFRRIGDWAAGTLVVYTSKITGIPQNKPLLWLSGYEPFVPLNPLSHAEKQAIISFARRYPLLGEARANEIAGYYASYLKADNKKDSISDSAFLLGVARKLLGETSGRGNTI